MLHHMSLNARDPQKVAHALAHMLRATALRAPQPPFPKDSWLVCEGDAHGTLLEVMPWGEVRDATQPNGVGYDPLMRPSSGAHALLSTPLSSDEIFAAAAREGWRAESASAGLFQFIRVWVENAFLVELLPPELKDAYTTAFGREGLATLDGKLREIEQAISARPEHA
jgi:hypothetical protein